MATQTALNVDALVCDTNVGTDGRFEPPHRVKRRATFILTVVGRDGDATVDAIYGGETGKPLKVREVTRDDLNLPPVKAKQLAQAIYEGHYEINDHARPVRQSHLTGELNVEPYWENVILEKFIV